MKTKSESLIPRDVAEVDCFIRLSHGIVNSLGLSGPVEVDYWLNVCRFIVLDYKEIAASEGWPAKHEFVTVFCHGKLLCRNLFHLCDSLYESDQSFAGDVIRTAAETLYDAIPAPDGQSSEEEENSTF